MNAIGLLGVTAALASTLASAQPISLPPPVGRVPIITNPDWAQRPSAADQARVWPTEASKKGVLEGTAALHCTVDISGKLENCSVLREAPQGLGFGAAAINLSSSMVMKPRTVDGRPVSGAEVTIPVTFKSPSKANPASGWDTPPGWLRKPTSEELLAVYPRAAGQKGLGGSAMLHCWVKIDGLLRNCTVVKETPPDLGFGASALVLSKSFLMKPASLKGELVESDISIPIAFKSNGPITGPNVQKTSILGTTIWAKAPTMEEILAAIDKKVGDKFAEGKVVFICDVNKKSGRLSNCGIANTAPGMVQFTSVARSLVSKFQVAPEILAAIKDDTIRVNLAFSFPDMGSAAWGKRYITRPDWTRTVSPDPNQPLFPAQAADAGMKTGSATVDCVIGHDGSLGQCTVLSESTPNLGFGPLAQQIAQTFATNPWTDDGLPAEGAHVRMPVKMINNEAVTPAPTPPTKP